MQFRTGTVRDRLGIRVLLVVLPTRDFDDSQSEINHGSFRQTVVNTPHAQGLGLSLCETCLCKCVATVFVGSDDLVHDFMRRTSGQIGLATVARHIATMDDMEAAMLIASMSLSWKISCLECNVDR